MVRGTGSQAGAKTKVVKEEGETADEGTWRGTNEQQQLIHA